MMGGIIAGTAITLLFLPALYVAWFRIKEPEHSGTRRQLKRTQLRNRISKSPVEAGLFIRF